MTILRFDLDPAASTCEGTDTPPGKHIIIEMTNLSCPNVVGDGFDISEELLGGMTATRAADEAALLGHQRSEFR